MLRNVTCPFCALHCDDLSIQISARTLTVEAGGCGRAGAGFAAAAGAAAEPAIAGRPATLDRAIEHAAGLLRQSKAPLYSGLATDVNGMRAVLTLADRTGGVVDHLRGDALNSNNRTLQSSGWMTTTLSELRNRADLLIVLDAGQLDHYPRFLERSFPAQATLHGLRPEQRTLVLIGPRRARPKGLPAGVKLINIRCTDRDRLRTLLSALAAAIRGRAVAVTGISSKVLANLVERMRTCQYGVMTWFPATWKNDHGALSVELLNGMVMKLNEHNRFSGFSLSGSDGAATANSVCAWQTGYTPGVSFATGYPRHDPLTLNSSYILRHGRADLMCWIDGFAAGRPPDSPKLPRIVIGHPLLADCRAEVFIPVGQPGIHSSGHLIRCDSVVTLPVRRLRDSTMPSISTAVSRLIEAV
jgi:formylmethanofuran dehydrogenase subunit B